MDIELKKGGLSVFFILWRPDKSRQKKDKVKLLKGSTLFTVLLCPDGQEIL